MESDVIVALIGGISSVLVAWVTTRGSISRPRTASKPIDPIERRTPFLAVLALGIAITSLAVGVFSFTETTNPQIRVVSKCFTAHTADYSSDKACPELIAPSVPKEADRHVIDLSCPQGHAPLAAWHQVKGSHPASDSMYSIDANVENGEAVLYLRAREGAVGYAYLDVFVLCSRVG